MEDYMYPGAIGLISGLLGFATARITSSSKPSLDSIFLTKVKAIASNHHLTPEAKGSQILALTEAFNLLSQ